MPKTSQSVKRFPSVVPLLFLSHVCIYVLSVMVLTSKVPKMAEESRAHTTTSLHLPKYPGWLVRMFPQSSTPVVVVVSTILDEKL